MRISDGSGTRNWIFGYPESAKKWVFKASWTMNFVIFGPNFWHIWWFFKVSQLLRHAPLWKIIKYMSKFWQKLRKIIVQFSWSSFLYCTSKTWVSGTQITQSITNEDSFWGPPLPQDKIPVLEFIWIRPWTSAP